MTSKAAKSSVNANLTLDLNTVIEQLRASTHNAIVINNTDIDIQLYAYNDNDFIMWIATRKPVVKAGYYALPDKGFLSLGGDTIKVYINDEGNRII